MVIPGDEYVTRVYTVIGRKIPYKSALVYDKTGQRQSANTLFSTVTKSIFFRAIFKCCQWHAMCLQLCTIIILQHNLFWTKFHKATMNRFIVVGLLRNKSAVSSLSQLVDKSLGELWYWTFSLKHTRLTTVVFSCGFVRTDWSILQGIFSDGGAVQSVYFIRTALFYPSIADDLLFPPIFVFKHLFWPFHYPEIEMKL